MSDSGIKLADLFSAVNRKDKQWWERLSKEQQSKFSSWLYNRYMSAVRHSNPLMHQYYLMASNKRINRDLSKLTKHHSKLIYLLMTTLANEHTQADHQFVPAMKKNKANKATNAKMRVLTELNPSLKEQDLQLWAEIMTDEEFKQLMVEHGWDEKQIKAELKK